MWIKSVRIEGINENKWIKQSYLSMPWSLLWYLLISLSFHFTLTQIKLEMCNEISNSSPSLNPSTNNTVNTVRDCHYDLSSISFIHRKTQYKYLYKVFQIYNIYYVHLPTDTLHARFSRCTLWKKKQTRRYFTKNLFEKIPCRSWQEE